MAGIAAGSVLASSQASAANSSLPNAIVFDGTNTSEPTEYSFTVSDSVEAASVADNTNDEISGQTVQGTVNGSANAYVYSGTIQQLSNFGPGTVQFGNDPDNILPEPTHRIVVRSDSEISYEFTANGEVIKVEDGSETKAEDNDDVTQNGDGTWSVSGYTGNGYGDSYELAGEVLDFSPMTGSYSLLLNGEETTAYELTGTEPPEPGTGAVLGGGEGYADTVPVSDADYTVDSLSDLKTALSRAGSGDVVYLTSDVNLSERVTIPNGVTLASDRGINGSSGKRIHTDREFRMIDVKSNARITGIEFEGPNERLYNWESRNTEPSRGYPAGWALNITGSDVEIDNCELAQFAYAGVETKGYSPHIHHCFMHHNQVDGLGYGVSISGGHPTIEYCKFNYNRHSVATASGNGGFTIENCWFGPDSLQHVIDHHGPGSSTEMVIRNSTVEATHNVDNPNYWDPGTPSEALRVRGDGTARRTLIENNWFYHSSKPSPTGDDGEAIYLYGGGDWSDKNATLRNNHFGSDEPDQSIGHPRN